MSRVRRAFTLIELLVVIAIISVLAAILFPVFSRARAMARRSVCVSQMRQLAMAAQMYKQDFGEFPPYLSDLEASYTRNQQIFICPSDVQRGQYAGNPRVEGNLYLQSGVSYGYVPEWRLAWDLGWWEPAPNFGRGKWDDLTPLVTCDWHWATRFDPTLVTNSKGASGWMHVATAGGSVRKLRVENPIEQFAPEKYQ